MIIYHILKPGTLIQKYAGTTIYEITGVRQFEGDRWYTLSCGLLLPVKMEYILC